LSRPATASGCGEGNLFELTVAATIRQLDIETGAGLRNR
jgi:hypothetical protein